jgi:hypothetical protein
MKDETEPYRCKCIGGARGHVEGCPNGDPAPALPDPYRTPSPPNTAIAPIDNGVLTNAMAKLTAMQAAIAQIPELADVIRPMAQVVQQAIALRHAEERDEIADAKFKVMHEAESYTAYLERWRVWALKKLGVFGRDGSGLDEHGNAVLTPFGRERLRSFDAKNTEPRFAGFDVGRTGRDT